MERAITTLDPPAMSCPECLDDAPALPGSSSIIAWYVCSGCGHFWSARLRDGRPVQEISIDTSSLTQH